MVYRILAHWDAEAGVWWAESTDVKGLVAEADTLEGLVADLRELVPELLTLNHGIDPLRETTEITVLADRTETSDRWLMPSSYTPDVIAILTAHGCHYVRSGRHPIWYSPKSDRNFPVPTHIESRHTANQIMKQAGIAYKF